MKQDYFIVVLAHSLHGRLRRIQIPLTVIYTILALSVLGFFSVLGFVSSYARMAWKVANYNSLKQEVEAVRTRYQKLQQVVNQTNEQMASLQLLASEMTVAYGIKQKLEGPPEITSEGRLIPTFNESIEDYNYLRSSSIRTLTHNYAARFHTNLQPSIWPVDGRLMGHYGSRTDPFSGLGAVHTGVDISAPTGTLVRTTADGVVVHADRSGGYGRLIVVDHGNGMQTYYAHLSRFAVMAGQEVRRGEIIGYVGSTGRVTAPHLHYEVRMGGNPVNPYHYLAKASVVQFTKKDFPF